MQAFRWPPLGRTIRTILIANAAIWLVSVVAIRWVQASSIVALYERLALNTAPSSSEWVFSGSLWQLATYMWLHDLGSPWHLAFNMLVIWMFGAALEPRWGAGAFWRFYMLCGVGGGLLSALAGLAAPGLFGYPIVGASGAALGLLAAYSLVLPNQTVLLAFVVPVQSRWLAAIAAALDVLLFLTNPFGFAVAAHLGGLLTGWLLVTGLWRPSRVRARINHWKQRRRLRVHRGGDSGPRPPWVH